ncbi:hypothetical protein [Streptomyces sp. NPDC048527]|uniref:hypothetical protein n=1 Tax=Streptomyces sp. NPDC048527 TaxID=3365568 RepID=UPI0037152D9B
MRWSDEIRDRDAGLAPSQSPKVDEKGLQAAVDLADALSVDSLDQIPDLTDHYRQDLLNLIDAKSQGRTPGPTAQPAPDTPAVDLMAALKTSAERARKARLDQETPARGTRAGSPQEEDSAEEERGSEEGERHEGHREEGRAAHAQGRLDPHRSQECSSRMDYRRKAPQPATVGEPTVPGLAAGNESSRGQLCSPVSSCEETGPQTGCSCTVQAVHAVTPGYIRVCQD